jgi:stage V sporulation protein D (sporulation-specific penicillin-binding protein)
MAVFGVVAFIILGVKLYQIQIIDHERYESAAIEQQLRDTTVTAVRGTIYDRTGTVLAMSASAENIFISPAELIKYNENPSEIASALAEMLGVEYDTIMKKWDNTASWHETIAQKVDDATASAVRSYKNENDLKSVHLEPTSKRYYPYSTLASQIIGFVGTDNYGLEGIEAVYNNYLEGVNGRIVRATTENGVDMLYLGYENYYDAADGDSLTLTLDSTIQYYLEKNLAQAVEDYQLENGAMGIVMDVKTGAVLGMTSLPDYDLNNFLAVSEDKVNKLKEQLEAKEITEEEYNAAINAALLQQWRNRIISDTYEPGSTFKIITLAMGLEEGVISENDEFFCGGSIEVKGRADDPVHCWSDGHGSQTLAEAAQHSCNVAFVNIGLRMGEKRFYDYVESFGFFDKTGIDLYGEGSSIWWPRSVFEDPNNYSQLAAASFGQTFNITPIQLITAVSAVANGGYLMEPYIVSRITDSEGEIISTHEPKVVRQVISEETSRRVCSILESVVGSSGGTGKNAYVAGYRVAGKTGTSVDTIAEASGEKKYKVSFIGFAPADDPQIAVLVILDSPSSASGIYISGGVMAAPVVGKIMSDVLPHIGVEQQFEAGENTLIGVKVPNVKGLGLVEAKKRLNELGFEVTFCGTEDTITDQAPMANVTVAEGSTIILYAGDPKPTDTVAVPNLSGMNFRQARAVLQQDGLFLKSTGVAPSDSRTIVVAGQGTSAGSSVAFGSVVQVTLIDNDKSIMESVG